MNADTLVLVGRVGLSLVCVLGLVWFLARKFDKHGVGGRTRRSVPVQVVGRQSLGGRSSVAVVAVEGRQFLLGVGEQGVSMLTELDRVPDEGDTAPSVVDEAPAASAVDEPDAFALALAALTGDVEQPTVTAPTAVLPTGTTPAAPTTSTPAARMPAVPTPRSPLEGSILSATTWRRAMVAVQERTTRH